MNIYSIPPLFSSIVLFVLFVMGILKAKRSQINLLFALICFIGCFLNIDKTVLTITEDPSLAIRISRIDHLFLVFIIPLYLHFTVLATGAKRWMTAVKVLYAVAIVLAPVTQSPLYLTHVKKYHFGYFATSGPLFNLFGIFSALSLACSLYLLARTLRTEKVSVKKTRIKYILLSFGLAAFVNHFDVAVMRGYEVYPLGNFVFIPLSLLGYAIYKHDIMEWKIFLNKGIVFFTLLLTSIGFFTGTTVLLKNLLHGSINRDLIYMTAMILTFFLVYASKERLQTFIIQILQQEFIRNRRAIKELSFRILTLHDMEEITNTVTERLSAMFQLRKCEIRLVPRIEEQEEPRILDDKDELWTKGYRLSIPISSESHPSRLLLGDKGDTSLFTGEEVEILAILGNHIALAFDNASSYKRIQDFSESLERLIDERTQALIQSESLAAVGRLAAGVAHELNNPVASVMSTLEYQLDHLRQNDDLREDLTFALSELRRAKDIVRSLLDASRQKDEVKEPLDIHRPIEDALKILHNQYKHKKITLITDLNATDTIIKGNQSRLCQVFINIIRNAIDAIGDRTGTIRIETTNERTTGQMQRKVIVRITDTGEGIERGTLKDIFKPFFTTKQQGKGIGLGLYIVHEIIKDHGGTVDVESTREHGTTFTLTLLCLPQ